jgi:hypothetical protein
LADSGCDENSVTQWLDRNLLDAAERAIFPNLNFRKFL